MRLERDVRQSLVAELHEQGMSVRAIAPIVGASVGTVHADQQVFRTEQVAAVTPEAPDAYWSPEESFVGAHPITGEVIESEPVPAPEGSDLKSHPLNTRLLAFQMRPRQAGQPHAGAVERVAFAIPPFATVHRMDTSN